MLVFFLPDLRGGGAERVMLTILKELNTSSEEEIVLLLGEKRGKLLELIPNDTKVYELKATSATKSVIPFVQFCKKHKPHKVIASLGSSLTTVLAKPFISKEIEIINRLGNTIGAEKLLFNSKIKRFLYIQANSLIAKKSDKIIFQCDYMAKDFINEVGITPRSYKIIYNPIQIQHLEDCKDQGEIQFFDFVSVGRLSMQKDYITLVKAVDILKNQYDKNWIFLILGEGDHFDFLQKEIENRGLQKNLFLLGFLSNPYPFMKMAKALVSTSLYEGFSNVIVEAMALGTPIVASDCPGANPEVIREGIDGFLFEVGNAEELAKIILNNEIILQNINRFDISQNAKNRFDSKIIAQKYANYILK